MHEDNVYDFPTQPQNPTEGSSQFVAMINEARVGIDTNEMPTIPELVKSAGKIAPRVVELRTTFLDVQSRKAA